MLSATRTGRLADPHARCELDALPFDGFVPQVWSTAHRGDMT
ncbi:MAG: hypothetical protein U5L03_15000 [Burkholderiaceae bacterium]|nr:hypothetical protein [Burkholderiaceae bacterium]